MDRKIRCVAYKIFVVTVIFSLVFISIQPVWSGEESVTGLKRILLKGTGSVSAGKSAEELARTSSAGRAGTGISTGLSSAGIAGIAAAVVALVAVVASAQTSTSSHHP